MTFSLYLLAFLPTLNLSFLPSCALTLLSFVINSHLLAILATLAFQLPSPRAPTSRLHWYKSGTGYRRYLPQ
jgi:hypothetical protein